MKRDKKRKQLNEGTPRGRYEKMQTQKERREVDTKYR